MLHWCVSQPRGQRSYVQKLKFTPKLVVVGVVLLFFRHRRHLEIEKSLVRKNFPESIIAFSSLWL